MSKNLQRPVAPSWVVHQGRRAWRNFWKHIGVTWQGGKRGGKWSRFCSLKSPNENHTFLTLSLVWPLQDKEGSYAWKKEGAGVFVSFMELGFTYLLCLAAGRLRIKLYMKYLSPSYQSPSDEWLLRHCTDKLFLRREMSWWQGREERRSAVRWEKMRDRKKREGWGGAVDGGRWMRGKMLSLWWKQKEESEHWVRTGRHLGVCPQRTSSNRITHTSKRRFCFSSKK